MKWTIRLATATILAGSAAVSACSLRSGAATHPATPVQGAPGDVLPAKLGTHKGHVDVSTGLYIREDQDLIVPSSLPIVLTRTYLSGDRISRHFGVGTTHPGEWYLIGDSVTFNWAELILADGARIHFDRTSSGTSFVDAVFRHTATATHFYGASLEWSHGTWALKFDDGSLARFQSCDPGAQNVCALIEVQDANGHRIDYLRDLFGWLLSMRSDDQRIDFEYDDHHRIVRARDSSQNSVSYVYDDRGRLVRVVASNGTMRNYTYSARDEMLTIDEPGWFIENAYDSAGRVVHQATHLSNRRDPWVYQFAYQTLGTTGFQTDVTENDGAITRYRFDGRRTLMSETYDAESPDPVSVTYDRKGPLANAVTVTCLGTNGPVARTVPASETVADDLKWTVITRECRSGRRALQYRD